MTEEDLKKFEEETIRLISDLGITATSKISLDKANNILDVQLNSAEAATLIGYHGETLQAIQLILTFFAHQIFREWVKVSVNVGDYRQKREEQLKKLALNLAMKVKFSGEAQAVPKLNSAERRFVHLVLADHPDVYTESEGEGRDRQLIIKPKN